MGWPFWAAVWWSNYYFQIKYIYPTMARTYHFRQLPYNIYMRPKRVSPLP